MSIVLSVIFSISIIAIVKANIASTSRGELFSAFVLSYWFYYGLIPFLVGVTSANDEMTAKYFSSFMQGGGMGDVFYFIIVSIFFFVFVHSYRSESRYSNYTLNYTKLQKWTKLAGYTSFFLGGISLLVYFHLLGGIQMALTYAEFNRSFAYSMEEVMSSAFILFRPAKLVILAPFCFVIIRTFSTDKKINIYYIASIVLALLFYLYDASRSSLMIYLVALLFPYLQKITKHPWRYIFIGGMIGLNLLNVLDSLFVYFATGDFDVVDFDFAEILQQFSHPYRTACFSFDIVNQGGVRLGKDFITDFLSFIPGVNFDVSYEQTCSFFLGLDWRNQGGIPNDIITFSVIEFHFLGLIIIPVLLGKILRKADCFFDLLKRDPSKKTAAEIIQAYLMMLVFFNTASSDFVAILQGYSLFVFFFIALVSLSRTGSLRSNIISPHNIVSKNDDR